MKTKTTLYLSIILSTWLIGKIFNPIPFSNYAFYIIVVTLFVPYFGKWGCLKIVLFLTTITVIQDIPFYISIYQSWPAISESIIKFANYMTPTSAIITLNDLDPIKNGVIFTFTAIFGFYLGVINAFYALTGVYKKIGVYKRLSF